MAHFYTSATNSRGNLTTASGLRSGQTVHARGWNSGVKVISKIDQDGRDVFYVYRTAGSGGAGCDVFLGRVVGDTFIPATAQAVI